MLWSMWYNLFGRACSFQALVPFSQSAGHLSCFAGSVSLLLGQSFLGVALGGARTGCCLFFFVLAVGLAAARERQNLREEQIGAPPTGGQKK